MRWQPCEPFVIENDLAFSFSLSQHVSFEGRYSASVGSQSGKVKDRERMTKFGGVGVCCLNLPSSTLVKIASAEATCSFAH